MSQHGLFVTLLIISPQDFAAAICLDCQGFGFRISSTGKHNLVIPHDRTAGGKGGPVDRPERLPCCGIISRDFLSSTDQQLILPTHMGDHWCRKSNHRRTWCLPDAIARLAV